MPAGPRPDRCEEAWLVARKTRLSNNRTLEVGLQEEEAVDFGHVVSVFRRNLP